MKSVRILGALAAALAIVTLVACGPSFQAIYEGNARFEHCYALEESTQTTVPQKAECWHDWSTRYTYGQTRDRIHYATARYVALSQTIPTDEAMMMAAPGMTRRQSTITAPNPTNAFAPPPKVLEEPDASAGKPARPSEERVVVGIGGSSNDAGSVGAAGSSGGDGGGSRTTLPASECSETCTTKFRGCAGVTCEKTYRACMRGCFK